MIKHNPGKLLCVQQDYFILPVALKAKTHTQHSLCYLTECNTHAVYCIFISALHVTTQSQAKTSHKPGAIWDGWHPTCLPEPYKVKVKCQMSIFAPQHTENLLSRLSLAAAKTQNTTIQLSICSPRWHMWDVTIKSLLEEAWLAGKSGNAWLNPNPQSSFLVSVDKFCPDSLQGTYCSSLSQSPVSTLRSDTVCAAWRTQGRQAQ